MKRIAPILITIIVLCLSGCDNFSEGFDEGYRTAVGESESLESESANQEDESVSAEEKDSDFFTGELVSGEPYEIDSELIAELVSIGYTLEQASTMQKILNMVGIESIEFENMTGKPTEGLNAVVCYPNGLTDSNRRFHFTTENGELFYAGFSDEDLYDSDKGGFLKSYGEVHVPETKVSMSDYNELQMLAKDAVKSYLTVPSSANIDEFSWGIGRSDDKYKIIGKLTARNAFNVKGDVLFAVWFIHKDGIFEVNAITLDGVRVK